MVGVSREIARASLLTACLATVLAVLQPIAVASQQPQSGIDPCSRAIAQLATPVETESPGPSANRMAVSQAVMNFASCFNRRTWDGVSALTSDAFRTSMFGVSGDEELRIHLDELDNRGLLPQLRIQSIEENGTTGSALATLVVTWQAWSGLHQELWRLQNEAGYWVLSGRSIQSPSVNGAAVGVRFKLDGLEMRSPAKEIANPGTIIFAFENLLDQAARVLVLKVENSATTEAVIDACNGSGPIGHQPVAGLQVPPGQTISIPMFDLEDGSYAIIAGESPCAGVGSVVSSQVEILRIVSASEG